MDTISLTTLSPDAPNPIFIYREAHSGFRRPHRQDFFEVGLVKQGRGIQTTLTGEQQLEPGDVFLIPPSAWHGLIEAEDLRTEFCCFSVGVLHNELSGLLADRNMQEMLGFLRCRASGIVAMRLSAEEMNQYLAHTEDIFKAAGGDCFYQQVSQLIHQDRILAFWRQIAHLTLLLAFLCERYAAYRESEPGSLAIPSSIIREVVARMEAHPDHPWTLGELAAVAYLEPSYFLRRFSKEVGIPPLRYLYHLRMQRASDMLISTRKPIHQIAEESGYPIPAHFSARFREYFRVSPVEYRRMFNTPS